MLHWLINRGVLPHLPQGRQVPTVTTTLRKTAVHRLPKDYVNRVHQAGKEREVHCEATHHLPPHL